MVNYWKAHKPVRFICSYCMFCPLHSSISIKSTSAIHTAITENTEDSLMKFAPHILMCESHSTLISLSHFELISYNIIAMTSVSTNFVSCTEAIMRLPQIITYTQLWRKNRDTKGFKGSTMMQALYLLWLVKRHILWWCNNDHQACRFSSSQVLLVWRH